MEPEGEIFRNIKGKNLGALFVNGSLKLTFQQKSLNLYGRKAFDDYCRIFVYINDSEEDFTIAINDPLPFSSESLKDLHDEFKKLVSENSETFLV